MRRKLPCARTVLARPPGKPAFGKPFLAQPEPLAIIYEHFNGVGPFIAKDEHMTRKRIGSQNLSTHLSQTVNAFSEIRWRYGQEYSHLRGDLNHERLLQNALPSSKRSRPASPLKCIRMVAPF